MLHYKKPAVWVVAITLLMCTLTAACFLTDPVPCNHSYESEAVLASTCTEKGVERRTCRLCHHSYTAYMKVCDHSYDAGTVTEKPTCVQTGKRKLVCSCCGAEKWEAVERLPHTPGEPFVLREPNCTEKGEKSATCTVCKTVFTVEIMDTNGVHDMRELVIRQPTCAEPGEGVNACTRCGYSESIRYERLAHNYKDGFLPLPNCREEGKRQKVCTACGDEIWETAPRGAHKWGFTPARCLYCGISKEAYEKENAEENAEALDLLKDLTKHNGEKLGEVFPGIPLWP